jgi:SAM-dependent methyltransferase
MHPTETGRLYDQIANWWQTQQPLIKGGLETIRRAAELTQRKRRVLDVGCGAGRAIPIFQEIGFEVTGIDVSAALLDTARQRHPDCRFVHDDIREWPIDQDYDLIVAWDSIFHVPYGSQRQLTEKLCKALQPGAVLLFTGGGIDGQITSEMNGQTFYYSSLADDECLRIANACGCKCVLLERDQYPEKHTVYVLIRE